MIVDIMKEVAGGIDGVNFQFGSVTYASHVLTMMGSSASVSPYKFPLILLHLPTSERHGYDDDFETVANVSITLAVETLSRYTNEERYELSFKAQLEPLLESFFEQIKAHKLIDTPYNDRFKYVRRDRYDLGARGAMDSNGKAFSYLIDAIEIENLELKIKTQKCYDIHKRLHKRTV